MVEQLAMVGRRRGGSRKRCTGVCLSLVPSPLCTSRLAWQSSVRKQKGLPCTLCDARYVRQSRLPVLDPDWRVGGKSLESEGNVCLEYFLTLETGVTICRRKQLKTDG